MEIGSFIELDIKDSGEYHDYGNSMIRLNSGRASIYHAMKLQNTQVIYLPYYLCPTVIDFLSSKKNEIRYYSIDKDFEPILDTNDENSSLLIVNYFGIFSNESITEKSGKYNNVIVDNSPSFFSNPISDVYNVYSLRKFFGVPDGSYLIGKNANNFSSEYKQDISSGTASYLLKRIEHGSSAIYQERMQNEKRIDSSDILKMSELTLKLIKGIDYMEIRHKRKENFLYAHEKLADINQLPLNDVFNSEVIPMVYPLLIENQNMVHQLAKNGIYTGRWWNHVLKLVEENSFEAYLSKYMIPIPIDQRYGEKEIDYINKCIREIIS
jgi:hypothetical protein